MLASDDGGDTWAPVATLGPLWWPQAFSCESGVYVLGTLGPISLNNDVVISRMLDRRGARWSAPARLTRHVSAVTANQGVDVSSGRVTKAVEILPALQVRAHTMHVSHRLT